MALSGSVTTNYWYSSDGQSRGYALSWTATQSIAKNQSVISWTLATAGTYQYTVAERTLYAVIAGTTVVSKTDRVMRGAGVIASGSFAVNHASDGTYGFSASVQAAVYGSSINCSGSGDFALDQIARQANITDAPNFNDEENPTITYSNPAGDAVSSLMACISLTGSEDDIAYREIPINGNSYTFNLTDEERNILRNATLSGSSSRNVYFYVKTVIAGNVFYSEARRTFSVINAEPTLEASAADSNPDTIALTGDENVFVRYMSNAAVSITGTAKKGASITSRRVKCGNAYVNTNQGMIPAVESGEFIFSVADNRGNITSKTVKKTLVEYIKPTCVLEAHAPDADGDVKFAVTGSCFSGSFGAVENSIQAYYRYKEENGEYGEWTAVETTAVDSTYRADVVLTNLDYTKKHTFQARVTDSLMLVESVDRTVKTIPVFDWGENDFNFNVPVFFGSGIIGNEYVSNDNGHYYKYHDGTLICAKEVYVNTSVTTEWGSLYDSTAISLGEWAHSFVSVPTVSAVFITSGGGFAFLEGINYVGASTIGETYLCRAIPTDSITGYIHVIGIGRWK